MNFTGVAHQVWLTIIQRCLREMCLSHTGTAVMDEFNSISETIMATLTFSPTSNKHLLSFLTFSDSVSNPKVRGLKAKIQSVEF